MSKDVRAVQSNVFFDTFDEMMHIYENCAKEIWEETKTVSLFNTPADVGLFDKSDIIIVYDEETLKPTIVTERIYKKNYKFFEWVRMKNYLRHKTRVIKQELGFNIRISYSHGYIDYIHYKEEWWQWALKRQRH